MFASLTVIKLLPILYPATIIIIWMKMPLIMEKNFFRLLPAPCSFLPLTWLERSIVIVVCVGNDDRSTHNHFRYIFYTTRKCWKSWMMLAFFLNTCHHTKFPIHKMMTWCAKGYWYLYVTIGNTRICLLNKILAPFSALRCYHTLYSSMFCWISFWKFSHRGMENFKIFL